MEYAIITKTPDNLGVRYDAGTGESRYFFTGKLEKWVNDENRAKRWKTREGAAKTVERLPRERILFVQQIYLNTGNGFTKLLQEYEIVEVKELPKVQKSRLTTKQLEEKKKVIVKYLLQHGWKPNIKYLRLALNDEGFTNYGLGYLIDSDDRFAVTLKASVMTVHDGSRQFCKVISMGYNEITFGTHELICGKIALKM
jgi:hypothetical protein